MDWILWDGSVFFQGDSFDVPAPAPTIGFPSLIWDLKASRICFRSVGGLIFVFFLFSCRDYRWGFFV